MRGGTYFVSRTMHTVRSLLRALSRPAVVLALVAGSVFANGAPAHAYTHFSSPLTGGTDFATGFPGCSGGIGPVGIIHDGTNFFATDICNKTTYKFPAGGGAASSATSTQNLLNLDLAVSHGKYYAGTNSLPTPAGVYSFDPATLAVGNLIAAFPQTPYGLIGDPLSDDLYVATGNGIFRIQSPDTSPVVTKVVAGGTFDGIAMTADGQHIWAANRNLDAVQEYGRPNPTTAPLQASVHVGRGVDGMAIAQSTAPGGVADNVFVNDNDGTIVRIDTNNGNAVSVVASGGTRGDFATVGPDGCFYVTQTDRVVKLAPCFFQSPTADLSVLQVAPAGAGVLQAFSYNILVTNAGPSPATNATFTDTLPAGVTFVSASSGQGTCGQAAGVLTCNLGSMPSGASVTATVAVTAGLLPGTLNNTASVKATEADPNLANNTSTATTNVGLLPVTAPVATPTPPPIPAPNPSATAPFGQGKALPVTGPRFPLGLLGLLGVCLIGIGVVIVRKTRGAGSPPRG